MKSIIVVIMSLLVLVSVTLHSKDDGKQMYQCPMKCEGQKTYDKPGKCPVCKMNLQEIKKITEAYSVKTSYDNTVKIVGAMMNVMHKGELNGTISLDTISRKAHLYGIGPAEYLTGEIMILDGSSYISTVQSSTEMKIAKTYNVKAPFFVYANVNQWKEISVPQSVTTIPQFEKFLDGITKDNPRPFAFKVSGTVRRAVIHVVNLPKGTKVTSPEVAHIGEQKFTLKDRDVDVLGFFSTEHKGVFTHHDTYVHMHLMTSDKKMMGHLDEMQFVKGRMKLYLPEK